MIAYGGLIIGVLTLLFGILVLAKPKILAYLIGAYLIIVGIIQIIIHL